MFLVFLCQCLDRYQIKSCKCICCYMKIPVCRNGFFAVLTQHFSLFDLNMLSSYSLSRSCPSPAPGHCQLRRGGHQPPSSLAARSGTGVSCSEERAPARFPPSTRRICPGPQLGQQRLKSIVVVPSPPAQDFLFRNGQSVDEDLVPEEHALRLRSSCP